MRTLARALPPRMRGKLGLARGAQQDNAPQGAKAQADDSLEAAEHAYQVLQDDPPGRVRSDEPYDWRRRPLAWLRENGRYLTPTGAGDYVYAAGLAIRNWFSLHYVIGTALLLLFALVAFLKTSLAAYQPALLALLGAPAQFDFFALHAWAIPDPSTWSLWWSPLWVLPLAVVALWLVPSGIAFWLIAGRAGAVEPPGLARRIFTLAAAMDLALALLLARVPFALDTYSISLSDAALVRLKTGSSLLAALALLGLAFHVVAALVSHSAEGQRVEQTRALAAGMQMLLGLAVLALLDTLSQTFYFWLSHADAAIWGVLSSSALTGALVWLVQKLATRPDGNGKPLLPAWLPLDFTAAAGAVLLLLAVATAWAMLVQWLSWGGNASQLVNGDVLAAQYPGSLVLVLLALVPTLINGLFPSFINLSTLQAFYSARITRAYLGASNGARFDDRGGARVRQRRRTAPEGPDRAQRLLRRAGARAAAPDQRHHEPDRGPGRAAGAARPQGQADLGRPGRAAARRRLLSAPRRRRRLRHRAVDRDLGRGVHHRSGARDHARAVAAAGPGERAPGRVVALEDRPRRRSASASSGSRSRPSRPRPTSATS